MVIDCTVKCTQSMRDNSIRKAVSFVKSVLVWSLTDVIGKQKALYKWYSRTKILILLTSQYSECIHCSLIVYLYYLSFKCIFGYLSTISASLILLTSKYHIELNEIAQMWIASESFVTCVEELYYCCWTITGLHLICNMPHRDQDMLTLPEHLMLLCLILLVL